MNKIQKYLFKLLTQQKMLQKCMILPFYVYFIKNRAAALNNLHLCR